MCCDPCNLNETVDECEICGYGIDADGDSTEVCGYSPVICEICGAAPCDDSC